MGISRDSRHKRRLTGGRRNVHQKKRKYELGRPAANTKLGTKRVSIVRVRGGNRKFRALRLDAGTFSWGSEAMSRKCRILDVVYNASNNELVRTKTIVKNCIVQIDAHPFIQWFKQHYGVFLGKGQPEEEKAVAPSQLKKQKSRNKGNTFDLESRLSQLFKSGRVFACISSRPGQSGRADGYILEGAELDFYTRKMQKKKGKGKGK